MGYLQIWREPTYRCFLEEILVDHESYTYLVRTYFVHSRRRAGIRLDYLLVFERTSASMPENYDRKQPNYGIRS